MFQEEADALVANLEFDDFKQAFQFMTYVAELAEAQQHHPDWHNVYNKVTIKLSTHDADNNITDKDRKLAASIESHAGIQKLEPRTT